METEAIGGDLYDSGLGSFASAAIPSRAYPLVLPTADNQAVILGGGDYNSGLPCRRVDLYNPATNRTTTLIDKIFPDKSYVSFSMSFDLIDSHRIPGGRYLLTARASNAFLFSFDPSTKQIAEYRTSAPLPGDVWLHSLPLVDKVRGRAYLLATLGYTFPVRWRLYTLNLKTGELNNPTGYYQLPDDFRESSAITLLPDGRLMVVGGEEHFSDIYNRQASSKTWFITPNQKEVNPGVLELLLN